ncbi:P-loop NTPase fold protein [Paenibacillus polymyxa]|uniref:P-loop NTPase fold protein n=1 Tax=Paenibacillus polymyxa TaxID=1406 RepID=UPI00202550A5|nr:P-loop NTPase fold protein [Paenibacillus polymyxa]URJ58980.3 P-loop NTPase fold protein [Paenibacillus polymyxa]
MYLTDEKIIDLIVEYVTDDRYKQAVLIDGDWGSGKTYFVQEKLIKSLKDKIEGNAENIENVLYVSLYGMENLSQIIEDIYSATLEMFFDKKLGEGTGQKIGKGINIVSKLMTTGMKYFNLDKDDLPKLSDVKTIKNCVVIFDDLERCSIDINQLLGFINNLVEHNSMKVIIVANQSEIGKPKLISDLPHKYSVVLNPNLKPNESKDKGVEQDKSPLTKKQLQEYTEQVFSEDILYEKVKEKLIGLTINYKANINDNYEEIIGKYIKHELSKENLILHKEVVISIFEKRQHSNIRTLIFALIAYEKILMIVSEIEFQPNQFLVEQYKRILCYIIELSIQIKTGKQLYSWTNSTSKTGMVYLGKGSVFGESVFGYRFVDTYLNTRFLDSDEVKSIILSTMNEEKVILTSKEAENSLSFNRLYMWWYLEDEQVSVLLENMLSELSEKKYHPRYFKDIIIMLMQLRNQNFSPLEYDNLCEACVNYMQQRLETMKDGFTAENLEVLSDDQEFIKEYNLIMKPLFDVLYKKDREEKEKINESMDLDKSWGEFFKSSCLENKSLYTTGHKFLFYVNPEKVIEKLSTSTVNEIYSFLDGIKEVYSFSNLNDFFKDDINHINKIIDKLNIEELSNNKTTKRIALEKLKVKLENSRDLIQR